MNEPWYETIDEFKKRFPDYEVPECKLTDDELSARLEGLKDYVFTIHTTQF